MRWQSSPSLRALMALVVIATLLVGTLAAGWIRLQNPVIVAPSGSALTSPAPTDSPIEPIPTVSPGPTPRVATPTCSAATDVDDIRDTWRPRNRETSWVSEPPSLDGNVAGEITAIATDLPEIDLIETPKAVVLIHPSTGNMCRLASLPSAFDVFGLHWSPSGDALAIVLHPPEAGPAQVLVWSSLGITRPWVGAGLQGVGVAWSPDGSTLAILTEGKAELVFADGSPTAQIDCVGCGESIGPSGPPSGPYYFGRPVWSPDGSKIALTMMGFDGSRIAIAEVARRRASVLDLGISVIEPVAWPDNENLLIFRGASSFVIPIATPRERRLEVDFPFASNTTRYVLAPDLRHAAYIAENGVRALGLVVVDLHDGSVVLDVKAQSGEMSGIDAFAWAPDSQQLVYTRRDSGQPEIHGLWVVEIDPLEEHQTTRGQLALSDMSLLRSSLDGGSWRESIPGQP